MFRIEMPGEAADLEINSEQTVLIEMVQFAGDKLEMILTVDDADNPEYESLPSGLLHFKIGETPAKIFYDEDFCKLSFVRSLPNNSVELRMILLLDGHF